MAAVPGSVAKAVDQPLDGAERLQALAREQHELLERFARERDATAEAQLAEGDLVVDGPDAAEEGRLRKLIEPRLPELDLPELLIEVDGWTGFTDHLVPLSGNRRRSADMPALLYAVILAQATNLGATGMARASEFSYQQLEWVWEQLCREDTLTTASASLVDYHHGLPLAQGVRRLHGPGDRSGCRGNQHIRLIILRHGTPPSTGSQAPLGRCIRARVLLDSTLGTRPLSGPVRARGLGRLRQLEVVVS